MATATQLQPIRTIPESPQEREAILEACPRLIITVAGRCRVDKSEVSRVWNLHSRVRLRAQRIRCVLIKEVNRRLAKAEHSAQEAGGNGQ